MRPVNRLPPEALTRIVQYVPDERDTDAMSILILTHVCRYWRGVITSTPWNWKSVSNRSHPLAEFSLKCAKSVSLEISVDMMLVRKNPGFSDVIRPHVRNTKSIHFAMIGKIKDLTQAIPNFPQSMPNLQSLAVDAHYIHRSQVDPFESLAPTLRYLELNHTRLYPSLLRLRALKEVVIRIFSFSLHFDTFLDFLEQNHSLESVTLEVIFEGLPQGVFRHRSINMTKLKHLSIGPDRLEDASALIRSIPLKRGAHLEVVDKSALESKDALSDIPTAHLANLSSPTSMEYHNPSDGKVIRLFGPNGSFSYQKPDQREEPFEEFPVLPLDSIREVRLIACNQTCKAFDPSFFPSLEMLALIREQLPSSVLSTVLSNPYSLPKLKTLAFLGCDLCEDFMEELMRFASGRRNTSSAWLHRMVIVDSRGNLPNVGSLDALEKYVPVVDVRVGKELPKDLA